MPYVLLDSDGGGGYYGGSTYVCQGELFPAYVSRSEAKKYKSEKVAKRSAEKLNRKVSGFFEVVDLETEKGESV